jgi:hypothetical protein
MRNPPFLTQIHMVAGVISCWGLELAPNVPQARVRLFDRGEELRGHLGELVLVDAE